MPYNESKSERSVVDVRGADAVKWAVPRLVVMTLSVGRDRDAVVSVGTSTLTTALVGDDRLLR